MLYKVGKSKSRPNFDNIVFAKDIGKAWKKLYSKCTKPISTLRNPKVKSLVSGHQINILNTNIKKYNTSSSNFLKSDFDLCIQK